MDFIVMDIRDNTRCKGILKLKELKNNLLI